jgi:hypothetical protein
MGIYDGLKDAAKVLQESGKIEQYRQILDAQEKMLEMQKRIGDLEVDNKDLREKLESKGKLKFEKNAYWIREEKGADGPFCSRCWDADKQLIRMQPCGNPAYFDCPNCKNKGVQINPDQASIDYQSNRENDDNSSVY